MPGVVTHTCNSSIEEAETDGFVGPLADCLPPCSSERPVLRGGYVPEDYT